MLKPTAYQENAIEFALKRFSEGKNAYIIGAAGCGKTLIAAKTLEKLSVQNAIIIAPTILHHQWKEELKPLKHIPNKIVTTLTGLKKQTTIPPKHTKIDAQKYNKHPTVIIFDEAHYLQNETSKRGKYFFKFLKETNASVLYMSATPFDKPQAIYSIYKREHPNPIKKERFIEEFTHSFQILANTKWGTRYVTVPGKPRNIELLIEHIKEFSIVITKEQSEAEWGKVPEVNDNIEKIKISTAKVKKIYEEIYEKEGGENETDLLGYNAYIAELNNLNQSQSQSQNPDIKKIDFEKYSIAARAIGEAKTEYVAKWLNHTYPNKQTIIFCKHINVLKKLYEEATIKHKTKCATCYSGNTAKINAKNIQKFIDGDITYLFGTYGSMSEGLNLQHCNNAVFVELPFKSSDYIQARARIYRRGQTNTTVTFTSFVLTNSLDEAILKILQNKMSIHKNLGTI